MNGITDTGSSCIIGPSAEINSIQNRILKQIEASVSTDASWDYTFPCSERTNLPSFELLYGGYWFQVNVEDYVIDLSTSDSTWGTTCALCFSTYESEWILGDAFMRGWYNIHDHDNLRMGFYSINTAEKTAPEAQTSTPTTALPDVVISVSTNVFGLP